MNPDRRRWCRTLYPAVAGAALLTASCSIPHWPVEGSLTSPFGVRFGGWLPEIHRGVDISVPSGNPVRAMAPGRVRFAGSMPGYGRVVWLDHGGDLMSVYGHLSEVLVIAGEQVGKDTAIGLSGTTGNTTGPHLHFEVWRHGREIDPVAFLGGPPGS